ncbi:MAG: type transport system ATP-binding protein [Eubacteriales bacterium]|nr:type transport system ATP-binding protein [Eubacteriales bacterium]MDN5363085.1 type transport system ATP-binding protein [Eubacteriales bacterium]
MLIFEGVSKSFGEHQVLIHCSFHLPAGQVWALVGPNGAGKTTTLRLAAGLLEPTSGKVWLDGHDVHTERDKVRPLIGFCPDAPFAYEFLTGREFLYFIGRLWKLPAAVVEERVEKVLCELNLEQAINRPIREYSRGMRQKLGFVVAVLHQPRLLLLDEPFTAVDAESERVMRKLLLDFVHKGGSVLFATHNMNLVEKLAVRCLRIQDGRIEVEETVARVRAEEEAGGEGDVC